MADLHPLLEIPTIKASKEFDNKSVEGKLTQEKNCKRGCWRFGVLVQLPTGQSVLGNSLQLSVNPFPYLLKKNLDDMPYDNIKMNLQMITKRLLLSSPLHLFHSGLLQKIPLLHWALSRPIRF